MKRSVLNCVGLAVAQLAASTAYAQQAPEATPPAAKAPATNELPTVVVTAEKRETTLQKTAIAIDVLTAEKLAQSGVTDINSLQNISPGVQIGQSSTATTVTVRGVSGRDTTEIGDPAVAINIDGVFQQRPSGMNAAFFDLERIEVLRGPQGTLYGRNATGGVVNVISKRPVMDVEGYAAMSFGNYNAISGEGAINVPLASGLAMRASVVSRQHDGYRDNSLPATANDQTNIPGVGSASNRANTRGDDEDTKGARLQFLFKPNRQFSALLSATNIRQSGVGPVQAGYPTTRLTAPTDAAEATKFPLNEVGDFKLTRKNILAEVNYDFGPAKLTYIGGYVGLDIAHVFDNDGVDTKSYGFRRGERSSDTSHEVRLASNSGGPFFWQTGFFLYNQDLSVRSLNYVDPNGVPIVLRNFQYDVNVKSKAAFGQVSYELTDALKVSAGLRSAHDTKERMGGRYAGPSLVNPPASQPVLTWIPETAASKSSDSDLSYHFGADYQLSSTSMVFAKVDKGYKSGGFTALNAYGPETVVAFEVGSKNRLFNNTMQLNVGAFHYNYKDQQVSQITNQGALVLNAGKSGVNGVEAQLDWRVSKDDAVDLSVNWLDGKFKDFAVNVSGVNVNQAGHRLIQAPEWAISAGYEHTFSLEGGGKVVPRLQALYRSESFFTVFNNQNDRQAPYTTLDASLTYTSPDKVWSVQAFGRNLTNTVVLTGANIGSFSGTNIYQFGAPRTYGVRIQASY